MIGLVFAGCAPTGEIPNVTNARIGQPTGVNGALYLTAHAYGQGDRLISARTTVARDVELHETVINADGTATMRGAASFELPARGSLTLEPGGYHLMLFEVDRLEVGDLVEVTLIWENAGEMTTTAVVVDPAETIIEEGENHDHD